MIGITVIGGCVRTLCAPSSASSSSGPPITTPLPDDPKRHESKREDGIVWDVDRFECKTFTRTVRDAREHEARERGRP